MNEILYQVVAIDSDLIKDCPDKVNFISQREDMSDGIIYSDYDFINHRYIRTYVSDNFNIYNRLEEKDKQLDKYKNVIDKIKEYIITRTPSDIGICGNKPKKYYTLNEDETDYILELLEEVE